jgi:PTS system nitrogen regulatory IIA component
MPHPRYPIVLPVKDPKVSLCFLADPIDFGADDGKPVHTLFTLVSPTVHEHLHLVARLALFLGDPGFNAAIASRATRDEILREACRVDAELKGEGVSLAPARKTSKNLG